MLCEGSIVEWERGGRESERESGRFYKQIWRPPRRHFHMLKNHESIEDNSLNRFNRGTEGVEKEGSGVGMT